MAAGFDRFSPALIEKYFPYFRDYIARLGISPMELVGLGRSNPQDTSEPFNMAYLAMRGCGLANGVSRLHGEVSRQIFSTLYPRWPEEEIPVSHVTNGVHVPSWDSIGADKLWTEACGKERWMGSGESLSDAIHCSSDEQLWTLRGSARHDLVGYARKRHGRQLGQRGADAATIEEASRILDPNILTLGFARRFAEYKRPNLLLEDPARLTRILTSTEKPVQLVVAGKAHPADETGKRLVKSWIEFCNHPDVRNHVVFLEDYDVLLAQELVQGVDVWINTPRRPWEACGTSGMKVLVNGGLNLSELDGWWAEAYSPDCGWALGDGKEHNSDPAWDRYEANQIYELLENEVVPLFYDRNQQGIPQGWVARIRASMAKLAPQFSSNRMAQEYVEQLYLPACTGFKRRSDNNGEIAKKLQSWSTRLKQGWDKVHFGNLDVHQDGDNWIFRIQAYLGDIEPEMVRGELIADPLKGTEIVRIPVKLGDAIPGTFNGYCFNGVVPANRPSEDFTFRLIGYHVDARIPIEASFILWQR